MISRLIGLIPEGQSKDTGMLVGGMAALLSGNRVLGVSLVGRGLYQTELRWRARHPEFKGSFRDRWQLALDHYDQTHQDTINRGLHLIGVPMVVGGAVGLFLFRPPSPLWAVSATSFSVGWVLSIVGHAAFEKGPAAFTDDALSFIAGPVWDFRRMGMTRRAGRANQTRAQMAPTAHA